MGANPSSNIHASGERSVAIGGNVSNSAIITGDVFIQHITAPVRRVRFDYAANIENFLQLYLGTPQNPVPFGGRDDALRALDAWLEDPARPYALLTAPAGRGKSALLVHWLTAFKQKDHDLPIVFLPVSARFSTNSAHATCAALITQLAQAYRKLSQAALKSAMGNGDNLWSANGGCAA